MLGQAIKMGFKWETLFKTQEKKKKKLRDFHLAYRKGKILGTRSW